MRDLVFCLGLGYCARVLARELLANGLRVAGTCRTIEKADLLRREGLEVHIFDGERGAARAEQLAEQAAYVLSSVPPDPEGDPALGRFAGSLAAGRARWIGYLSSTGVYGDHGGAWVDEDTPPAPTGARARRRLAAETGWLDLHATHDLPVHVFRLAGIYGPGRSALRRVRAGTARRVDIPGHVFSRVHVEDVASAIRASMARPRPGAIYNVCDDEPAPASDVTALACELLGVEPPPLIPIAESDLSNMARTFYRDCRRVSNARLKAELGVSPRYPSYREGLRAILSEQANG